ncbi:GIY-YIG nuclease family protein [Metamycoplasma auris]|uniref:Excinuclease ABC subunit C n=1 Tax=Metamycoplasma auris TaxID=51363 RepID=A0A2W7G5C3_9BACT|nr:GIY-YIG nuclease family protein [Metamycoplasma auris]PZW01467.1 excinuclease ABC subunit C [Metamycoplasma auris]
MIKKELIKNISQKPGVYFWKDCNNKIIYIGKAKNLKSRMTQYFDLNMQNSFKTEKMRQEISDFETYVFETEVEALIFERSSILKYKPKFNVAIPTQATFPYIYIKKQKTNLKIDLTNKYERKNDTLFYGPLVKGNQYLPLIKYLKHLLVSKDGQLQNKMNSEEIELAFNKAKKILKFGKEFKSKLIEERNIASENEDYYLAKQYQNIYDLIYAKDSQQNLVLKTKRDIDVFGFFETNNMVSISILHFRSSILLNKTDLILNINTTLKDFISNFLEEYYAKNQIPDYILLSNFYYDLFIDEGLKTHFLLSSNFFYKKLLLIAYENAKNDIENKIKRFEKENKNDSVISYLSNLLNTKMNYFAVFDNSFVSNTKEVVGASFVYSNGNIDSSKKRAYILNKQINGRSDFDYMYQNVDLFLNSNKSKIDLIFVDGGIIQIKAAKKAMDKNNIDIPIFGLRKNETHTFESLINEEDQEIKIDNQDAINYLIKIDNEIDAHAKKWYNKRHKKNMLESPLQKIKGIGKKTEYLLLERFKTYDAIYNAKIEELEEIIPKNVAINIKEASKTLK